MTVTTETLGSALADWYEEHDRSEAAARVRRGAPWRDPDETAVVLATFASGRRETTGGLEFFQPDEAPIIDAFGNEFRLMSGRLGFWDHDQRRVTYWFDTADDLIATFELHSKEREPAVGFEAVLEAGDEAVDEYFERATEEQALAVFTMNNLSAAIRLECVAFIQHAPYRLLNTPFGDVTFRRTPLQHAVLYGRCAAVQALLDRSVDVYAKDAKGRGLSFYAATSPCRELVWLFIQ